MPGPVHSPSVIARTPVRPVHHPGIRPATASSARRATRPPKKAIVEAAAVSPRPHVREKTGAVSLREPLPPENIDNQIIFATMNHDLYEPGLFLDYRAPARVWPEALRGRLDRQNVFRDGPTGLQMTCYKLPGENKWVLTIAGSDWRPHSGRTLPSWWANMRALNNVPGHDQLATSIVDQFCQKYGQKNIMVTGHSAGGRAAGFACLKTGCSGARTFNPMGLSAEHQRHLLETGDFNEARLEARANDTIEHLIGTNDFTDDLQNATGNRDLRHFGKEFSIKGDHALTSVLNTLHTERKAFYNQGRF